MSIVLEAQLTGSPMRRVVLRNGQLATFGSDVWTDFSFPAESGIAPRHFQLDCRGDRCQLVVLDQQSEVLHNEIPVRSAPLSSGDRLAIGSLLFRVQLHGLDTARSTDPSTSAAMKWGTSTAEACQGVELAPAAAAIVQSHPIPPECIEALLSAGLVSAGIRVLAAVLPPRAAVWWMFDFLQSFSQPMTNEPGSLLRLEIEAWILEPTEAGRRRIESLLDAADAKSPLTWLGRAAFWSGPTLAPAAVDVVPPPPHLVGTAVATAAQLHAAQHPLTMASTLRKILQHGQLVLDGQHPWPIQPPR